MANHSPKYYVEHIFSQKNHAPWCISCFRWAPVLKRRENSMNQCTEVDWLVLQRSLTSLSVVIFSLKIILCQVLLHLLYTGFPTSLGWPDTCASESCRYIYSTSVSTCKRYYSRVWIVAIVTSRCQDSTFLVLQMEMKAVQATSNCETYDSIIHLQDWGIYQKSTQQVIPRVSPRQKNIYYIYIIV